MVVDRHLPTESDLNRKYIQLTYTVVDREFSLNMT